MTDSCLVYVTTANREEAQSLGRIAVTERLAACANLLGAIESYYHWEGKFETASEYLLILKTVPARLPALTDRLRELHSYSCPAIVAVPIQGGYQGFIDWLVGEVAVPQTMP
jgi:periplasmic divalent cation tolerance protein